MEQGRPVLICSPRRVPGSGEAVCSQCGAPIYPTLGSLQFAQANGMPMICTGCVSAGPDYVFGGLMHHGQMVPISEDQTTELLGAVEKAAHREREEKRKGGKERIQ